jgi:murein DD-endopeptidase MepM/ murein hydrolase activator NlpD
MSIAKIKKLSSRPILNKEAWLFLFLFITLLFLASCTVFAESVSGIMDTTNADSNSSENESYTAGEKSGGELIEHDDNIPPSISLQLESVSVQDETSDESLEPTEQVVPPTSTLTPTPFPTWTSSPTRVPLPTTIPTWTLSPEPPNTPVPLPTFTPPPLEGEASLEKDHYLLERPISAEYTNWTDRIYPYGSTRGGLYPTHHGVEFFNPVGVPVMAAGDGVAVAAGSDDVILYGPKENFYGYLVIIQHDQLYMEQPVYSLYGHLSNVLVAEGQHVATGELIGLVGGTGVANGGAHLHFEVRVGENSYSSTRNPELWLRPFSGWGTLAGQLLWPDGSYIYGAPLYVERVDDPGRFVNRTLYTYADDQVNPDSVWRENFTSPDLEPGPYSVSFRDSELNVSERSIVWIYPDQTTFVTIQIDVPPVSEKAE